MDVAKPTYRIFEVCAGTGMLGIGVKSALATIGLRAAIVGGCEWESCAATAFLAGVELSQGGSVPVWDDATTFLGRRTRRVAGVDIVTAGYPCQPFSHAGKRHGSRDPRHLWPSVRRIIARFEPQIVFLENVDGHVSLGLRKVLRDLERLRYRPTAGVFSAEEAGTPHLRKRVFILGISQRGFLGHEQSRRPDDGFESRCGELGIPASHDERRDPMPGTHGKGQSLGGSVVEMGNAERIRRKTGLRVNERRGSSAGRNELANRSIGRQRRELADKHEPRLEGGRYPESSGSEGADGRSGIFPPGRNDYRRWADLVVAGLDPTNMPPIESGVSVVADGMASPADLLRLGGNGVVPVQAAIAFLQLFACLMGSVASGDRP